MLYQLSPDQYRRARPIFQPLRYNLVIDSVIDGNTPGWIYVDDPDHPRTAWLWNRQDAMLLAGAPENEPFNRALSDLITHTVLPDARQRHIPALALGYAPPDWEQIVTAILPTVQLHRAGRRYYTQVSLQVDWHSHVSAGYSMRRLEEALLRGNALDSLRNVDQVAGWILSFWHTIPDFLRAGFGYALFDGDTVASWCLSVFASVGDVELGLATVPDYRGRGLATLTAAACVEHCMAHGLVPHWHCWDDNEASVAVAAKVGFARPIHYTVYKVQVP